VNVETIKLPADSSSGGHVSIWASWPSPRKDCRWKGTRWLKETMNAVSEESKSELKREQKSRIWGHDSVLFDS
jgi:hypothetical protein